MELRRVLFLFQAEDGIRDWSVTGVQTCALLISSRRRHTRLVSDWSSDVCSSDLVYLVPMLMDRGYQPARAAELFSLFGIALLIGRFASGLLFDYFSARWVGAACLAAACVGVVILQLDTNSVLCALAIAMVAMAHGMEGDLAPYLAQRHFGSREYGTI